MDGKSLGEWIEDYYDATIHYGKEPRSMDRIRTARQAVLKIGTNGIPALLDRVHSRDSRIYQGLLKLLQNHPQALLKLPSAERRRLQGMWGFSILGEDGRAAVPALTALLTDRDPGVRSSAAMSLGYLRSEAEPAITGMLALLSDDSHGMTIHATLMGLREIGRRPDLVVPVLIPFIRADRNGVGFLKPALDVLSVYGTNAAAASPALQDFLRTNTVPGHRYNAFLTLEAIDPPAAKRLRTEVR